MLLIGSSALRYNGIIPVRRSADVDIIGTQAELDELQSGGYQPVSGRAFRVGDDRIIDFEVALPGSSAEDYLVYSSGYDTTVCNRLGTQPTLLGRKVTVARLAVLYSLKRSHRHKPRRWHKHIRDYHELKQVCKDRDALAHITKKREQEYTLKTPSLDKTVDEFFDDSVSNRVFIHDQIHEVMAHGERPLYESIRISPDRVTCSLAKWEALSPEDRLSCVKEEAYVIALERAIIPMLFSGGKQADPTKALYWALMRICTTLCSGWFRDFATENYPAIESGLDLEYHLRFMAAVDAGAIRRIA